MTTEDPVTDYRLETIVHIGAGRGRDLKQHRLSGASRIVLVDADRLAAATLRRLADSGDDGTASVEVIEAAIAGVETDAELRIYNLERVSSIREPSALAELYPGLKVIRGASVRTMPSSTLVEGLDLDQFEKNGLFIDAPGEERAILQRLQAHDLLEVFSHLTVKASVNALYEGAASAAEIAAFLREARFELRVEGDGEWRTLTAWSGRSARDRQTIARLQAELEQESKENAQLKSQIDKLKSAVAKHEASPVDTVDRKLLFDQELNRSEAQLSLLKNMLLSDRER